MAAIGSAGALVASGVAIVSGVAPAGAASFSVTNLNPNGAGSLDQAIQDANAAAGADVITFLPGLTGTITLTADLPTIDDDVDIQGPGAAVITVNGAGSFHPFEFEQAGASSISGLTVTAGDSNGVNGDDSGGGIALYDNTGSLAISNMVISGNNSDNDGGGVWCNSAGSLTISNSIISGNTTDEGGGALYSNGCTSVTVETSTISGNTAGSDGGGIYTEDPLTVRNTTISGNTGESGGGVQLGAASSDEAVFQNSTISGNTASDEGGAFYVNSGELTLVQTTVTGNIATTTGGIYSANAGATSLDAGKTPAEQAKQAAAGGVTPQQVPDNLNLIGTILAGNTGNDLFGIGSPGQVLSLNSLLGTVGAGTVVHDQGGTLTGVNPLLGPLANNGGPTQTHALTLGSPAINAGPNPVPAFPGNAFDQRGPGFARVNSGRVDIGAYEFLLVAAFTG
jgi:predicted outer membrane repeat protein